MLAKKGSRPAPAEAVPKLLILKTAPHHCHTHEKVMAKLPWTNPSAALCVQDTEREKLIVYLLTIKMVNAKGKVKAVHALLAVLKPSQVKQH